jgi:L-asparaginase
MTTIKIIVTGGTFDKEYDIVNGSLSFKETHLHEMLETGRCALDFDIEPVLLKDSLDLTENDKQRIVDKCKKASQEKIIITHGTDTMVATAKIIAKNVSRKTIVLTGALIPIKFPNSDGLFNLGCSLAFVQLLPYGVYICMNGRCYDWNNVRKNRQLGMFEEITTTGNMKKLDNYFLNINDANTDTPT